MPVRVELLPDAVDDLVRYAHAGNLPLFVKKLLRLEETGKEAGQPLRGELAGWRKIVVGDRDWRIVFRMSLDETVAVVSVIGDRDAAACHEEARRRLATLGESRSSAVRLAAALFQLSEQRKRRGR